MMEVMEMMVKIVIERCRRMVARGGMRYQFGLTLRLPYWQRRPSFIPILAIREGVWMLCID